MSEGHVRFQLRSDVATHDIDEGLLVVNLETGKTWKLNHVGAAVCRGIERGTDLAQIAAELSDKYRVAAMTVRKDVDALVENLRQEGLVEALPAG